MLSSEQIQECQSKFNLSYHVGYAKLCQDLIGFENKDVLEVGGSLPPDFVFDYLGVQSWTGIETPDYEKSLQETGGLTHQGTIIKDIQNFSDFKFNNKQDEKYNLYLENIEDLPEEYYEQYDLIFSIATFEHIHKLPLALDKMYSALKPGGKLFSLFSPIWSAHDGHHLPDIVDEQGNKYNFGNSPIPPWGHLLMTRGEMTTYLYKIMDKKTADQIVYYVYQSNHINRYFSEDYLDIIAQSPFIVNQLKLTYKRQINDNIYSMLKIKYPGKEEFLNNGILLNLEKDINKKSQLKVQIEIKNNSIEDNWQLTTPVALLMFNRPDTTQKVFDTIRQAKPPKLLVVADGARIDKEGEAELCQQTRAIIEQVDWDCEVLTNYSDVNLGCRKRVSSGLDWVFEQVEEAIILEDDCLPHPTFFRYCQELLEKYRDDERIMMISGDNFQFGNTRTECSYYFSRYGHVWGWATWRRAWAKNDDSMAQWEELRDSNWLQDFLQNNQATTYWTRIFQAVYDGFNTWDYIWVFTLWANKGLCILPEVNLVSNIGFGSGTHTTLKNSPFANMAVEAMVFPLSHPPKIERNVKADNFTESTQFSRAVFSSPSKASQQCKVCNSDAHDFATAKILQKYDVNYYQCSHCGFVQTEEPYWLEEAYSEAIASSDIGLLYRNNTMANITGKLLFNYFDHEAKFLDYGGGYGTFVRLMRDQGFDFYWQDKFCKNIFATDFELKEKDKSQLLLITAFELFEHLTNPVQELEEILKLAPNIFFSTSLLPPSNPKPDQWWYYTPHEGQHISIYTQKSLEILAKKYNLKLYTDGSSLHLLTTNHNLPENLFDLIKTGKVNHPSKESFLSRDFNQVVSKILSKNNSLDVTQSLNTPEVKSPIILIDGVFFQMYKTGIARVWKSLLEQWANTDFANHILVLDRAKTAPKINGIRYRTIQPYDYNNTDRDRQMLQQICDEEGAELFISTYYTTPINTPSVFMAYDMIPEVLGGNLNEPMWREKHRGIKHASAFIAISENTAKDIQQIFPEIPPESITVAHCGVDPLFSPATETEINNFKHKYGIRKPYFILGGLRGYKNAILFFQAFDQLVNKHSFDIVATGAGSKLPPEWRQYTAGSTFHGLQLSDEELRLAYAGAIALVYPSKYEGFGMPVIEAMACGCPVVTTPNSSLPEVGGNAAIYVQDNDILGLADALCEVQKPNLRRKLIAAGLEQAQKFSWTTMAEIVQQALFETIEPSLTLTDINYLVFPDWQTDEETLSEEIYHLISKLAKNSPPSKTDEEISTSLLIDITGITEEEVNLLLSGITMNLMLEEELDIENKLNFVLIDNLSEKQWSNLFPSITAKITLENENREVLNQLDIEDITTINSNGNNYAIFPNWKADEQELYLAISEVLKTIADNSEDQNLLVNISQTDAQEASLFFSEVVMNLLLEEGIELPESTHVSFVNFSANQWQSVSSLIQTKINLSGELLSDNLATIFAS